MLREFITETILRPVARAASAEGVPEAAGAEYRAGMVASQMIGLALARYVLAIPPVVQASPDDLARAIGPTLDRYLTSDIRRPSPHPPAPTPNPPARPVQPPPRNRIGGP